MKPKWRRLGDHSEKDNTRAWKARATALEGRLERLIAAAEVATELSAEQWSNDPDNEPGAWVDLRAVLDEVKG